MNLKFWPGKGLLVTGFTEFKFDCSSIWLKQLAAKLKGFALKLSNNKNLFTIVHVAESVKSVQGDICKLKVVKTVNIFQKQSLLLLWIV